MDTRHTVLLVLASMGLLKSVTGLLNPEFLKRFGEKWLAFTSKAGKAVAVLCVLVGSALWALVLYHAAPADWILLAFGMAIGWAGTVYLHPEKAKEMLTRSLIGRSNAFIRTISLFGLMLTSLLIWIALRG